MAILFFIFLVRMFIGPSAMWQSRVGGVEKNWFFLAQLRLEARCSNSFCDFSLAASGVDVFLIDYRRTVVQFTDTIVIVCGIFFCFLGQFARETASSTVVPARRQDELSESQAQEALDGIVGGCGEHLSSQEGRRSVQFVLRRFVQHFARG